MRGGVSLAVIVAPNDGEQKHLKRLLDNMKGHVDEICVTITGDHEGIESLCRKYDVTVSHFTWIDDFAAARNFNFSQCSCEWILWLDADDTLDKPEVIRDLIQGEYDGYSFLYNYNHDKNGKVIDTHWKMQLLRNDGHFEWKGAIHEDPIPLSTSVHWTKTDKVTRIHHLNSDFSQEKAERNLRILLKERDKDPEEPRTRFYLVRTYVVLEKYEEALVEIEEYLKRSGWNEERYEALLLKGECLLRLDRDKEAIEAYTHATLEVEDKPDAYLKKAAVYLKLNDFKTTLNLLKIAQSLPVPDAVTFHNPLNYTRDPYALGAVAYLNLGKTELALASVVKARSFDQADEYLKDLEQIIRITHRDMVCAQTFLDAAHILEKMGERNKLAQLLKSLPSDISGEPRLMALKKMYLPSKKWREKSIVVYCGMSAESWDPTSQKEGGIGGSETAVIELTKRFVKKGYEVVVYNQCDAPPEGIEMDGVLYRNFWELNWNDRFDILWIWRMPEVFTKKQNARLAILDMHDTRSPHDFTKTRIENVDKIFVKTAYHRSLYPHVPDDKFVIVGNGIGLDRFTHKLENDPNKFIYASSPIRGLDIILKNWGKIREINPKAELHVFYGWKTFYEIEKGNPKMMEFMENTKEMLKQPGVFDHGRKGQEELAKIEHTMGYWLYPTDFPEIHCITACEMQAAGVVPITSGYAALEETQLYGEKIPGDVRSEEWQEKFLHAIQNPPKVDRKKMSDEAKKAFDWDQVADAWVQCFLDTA